MGTASRWYAGLLAALWAGAASSPPPQPVYYIRTRVPAMALTFDVSWGDRVLPQVLDILRTHRQQATFFLSSPWALRHPALVHRIVADGHEVASHGEAHVNLGYRSPHEVAENIRAAHHALQQLTGQRLRFFRPPNGHFSPTSVAVARSLGYETVIWSIDSLDWLNPGVSRMIHRVRRQAFPGAILLFHASDSARQTPAALPGVLQAVRQEGYRLTTLGQLWQLGPPSREDNRGRPYKPNLPPATPGPAETRSTHGRASAGAGGLEDRLP